MKSIVLGLFAETFIHPGTGQSATAIDLPVAREAATDYPFIAGSSLKGALRDKARQMWQSSDDNDRKEVNDLFGKQDSAGNILVSDARLLLLPVRSLNSSYRWLTCPHLLERLQRDTKRAGLNFDFSTPDLNSDENLVDTYSDIISDFTGGLTQAAADEVSGSKIFTKSTDGPVFLEERSFTNLGEIDQQIIEALSKLFSNKLTKARLAKQLAIVSDEDFKWFANYGLAIQARNALDSQTKVTKPGALWYEESLPPDTLMYSVIVQRPSASTMHFSEFQDKLSANPYLQAGGNETVGQGWFNTVVLKKEES